MLVTKSVIDSITHRLPLLLFFSWQPATKDQAGSFGHALNTEQFDDYFVRGMFS